MFLKVCYMLVKKMKYALKALSSPLYIILEISFAIFTNLDPGKNNFLASWGLRKLKLIMKQLYSEISCAKFIIKGFSGAINQILKYKGKE